MVEPAIRPRRKKFFIDFRSEWRVFVWCFLLAMLLWLLVSLNESYNSTLNVRVQYLNLPKDKVFVRPLPEEIKISVFAKGWDLLGYRVRGGGDLIVDLRDYSRQNYILTRRLRVSLQQQISQKITINDIYPDTIMLSKETRRVKKVPVRLSLDLSFENHYALGDEIAYEPDSIVVAGPHSILDTLTYVETEPRELTGLSEIETVNVPLQKPPYRNLSYSKSKIKVTLPVYELSEHVMEVPVEIINKPRNLDIKLIPAKVEVSYQIPLNRYKEPKENVFELAVDGSQIDTIRKAPLRVQIISQPHFIYKLRLKQEYVDYIITR